VCPSDKLQQTTHNTTTKCFEGLPIQDPVMWRKLSTLKSTLHLSQGLSKGEFSGGVHSFQGRSPPFSFSAAMNFFHGCSRLSTSVGVTDELECREEASSTSFFQGFTSSELLDMMRYRVASTLGFERLNRIWADKCCSITFKYAGTWEKIWRDCY